MRRLGVSVSVWVLAVAVAGCATSSRNVPVENRVVVSGAGFEAVQGEADMVVRTFIEDENAARHEVAGATCKVTSSLYNATLVTPARLVVPNFGPQSPELLFDCTAGQLRGQSVRDISTTWSYAPGDPYPWGWPGGGIYGATGGVAVGYGWGGRPAYPRSNYRNLNILLR